MAPYSSGSQVVVLDNGGSAVKIGLAGQDVPAK